MSLDPPDRAIQAALDRGESPTIDYASERIAAGPTRPRAAFAIGPRGRPGPQHGHAGTLLIERYILYAFADGRLYDGRVHHAPYPVQSARVKALEETLVAAAGMAETIGRPLDPLRPRGAGAGLSAPPAGDG